MFHCADKQLNYFPFLILFHVHYILSIQNINSCLQLIFFQLRVNKTCAISQTGRKH